MEELIAFDKQTGEIKICSPCSNFSLVITTDIRDTDFIVLSGDYNGDTQNDIALYNQETGEWHILLDPAGQCDVINFNWGGKNFAIVPPADYDGDGCTELALYEAQNARWHIRKINGNIWLIKD